MTYGLNAGGDDYSAIIRKDKAIDLYYVFGLARNLSSQIHLPVNIIDHDEDDESILTVSKA